MTSDQSKDSGEFDREIEIEVMTPESSQSSTKPNILLDPNSWSETWKQGYNSVIIWFHGIPSSGKLVVLGGGVLLSLTLFKTLLQLISSLITLSVLGIIFYLVYTFAIAPKNRNL